VFVTVKIAANKHRFSILKRLFPHRNVPLPFLKVFLLKTLFFREKITILFSRKKRNLIFFRREVYAIISGDYV